MANSIQRDMGPISPNINKRYPKHWKQISDIIIYGQACGFCENEDCNAEHEKPHPKTGEKTILKAVRCEDKLPENQHGLKALCQVCALSDSDY